MWLPASPPAPCTHGYDPVGQRLPALALALRVVETVNNIGASRLNEREHEH